MGDNISVSIVLTVRLVCVKILANYDYILFRENGYIPSGALK